MLFRSLAPCFQGPPSMQSIAGQLLQHCLRQLVVDLEAFESMEAAVAGRNWSGSPPAQDQRSDRSPRCCCGLLMRFQAFASLLRRLFEGRQHHTAAGRSRQKSYGALKFEGQFTLGEVAPTEARRSTSTSYRQNSSRATGAEFSSTEERSIRS